MNQRELLLFACKSTLEHVVLMKIIDYYIVQGDLNRILHENFYRVLDLGNPYLKKLSVKFPTFFGTFLLHMYLIK